MFHWGIVYVEPHSGHRSPNDTTNSRVNILNAVTEFQGRCAFNCYFIFNSNLWDGETMHLMRGMEEFEITKYRNELATILVELRRQFRPCDTLVLQTTHYLRKGELLSV